MSNYVRLYHTEFSRYIIPAVETSRFRFEMALFGSLMKEKRHFQVWLNELFAIDHILLIVDMINANAFY